MLLVCLVLCALGGLFLALVMWGVPAAGDPAPGLTTDAGPEREHGTTDNSPRPVLDLGRPELDASPPREGVIQEMLPREGPLPQSEPLRLFDRERFAGLGTLRITTRAAAGVPFPEAWTLVLEPSDVLIGGQYASARRVVVTGSEPSLVLDDVPLGGYAVRAEAPNLNCMRKLILLAQPHETDREVFLELQPAGFLKGRVVDGAGNAIDGVPVVLEPLAAGTRRTTHTDPAGSYLFEDVLDGEYNIYAGVPESPLGTTRGLAMTAPYLVMPDLELPLLGELSILVLERGDIPAPAIHVTGFGQEGGRIDVTTNDYGEARARFLPAGWFTLLAQHGDGGRTRARVRLKAGESGEVVIVLER